MASRLHGTRAATVATVCASAMIASHVAGKAARDALFLSNFDVSFLPFMLIVSAVLSMVLVLASSRLLSRRGPSRLIPGAFALSAVLLLGEWMLLRTHSRAATVLLYMHMASLGGVLISGFWSVVNERFDPRTAKRHIGRIAAGGTAGGFIGGILAERVSVTLTVPTMIPIVAMLHVLCAVTVRSVGHLPNVLPPSEEDKQSGAENAFRILREAPYLRNLAVILLLVTIGGAMLDYVLKARAAQVYSRGEDLLRFFAVFYTAVAFGTFLIQTLLSGRALERFGIARTVAALPLAVMAGTTGALMLPGLAGAAAAKGLESVTNDSLFRSGYEILFTPIPAREKRATKPLIDVGFNRLGDLAGGALIRLVLQVAPGIVLPAALGLAMLVAAVGIWFARHLNQGYIASLEWGLLNRAIELDLDDVHDSTTRSTVLRSLSQAQGARTGVAGTAAQASTTGRSVRRTEPVRWPVETGPVAARNPRQNDLLYPDPIARTVALLRSGDLSGIRQFLGNASRLDADLVPHLIALLAWDEVYAEVLNALRKIEARVTGQLTDALLDPEQSFAVRRRIPRVLYSSRSRRAIDGLVDGLSDARFEVRFQCALALTVIGRKNPQLRPPADRIYAVVQREAAVDRNIWEGRRLLDRVEDSDGPIDLLLNDRASRSLEHVFRLLSLVLPSVPVNIAFRGLHARNENLRGIALEYLETILPDGVREVLWPFLEDDRPAKGAVHTAEEILDTLVSSQESIELDLASLNRHRDLTLHPGIGSKEN